MRELLENPTVAASVAAVLVAAINLCKKWLELRDAADQRATVRALHGNAKALEALEAIAADTRRSTGDISSGPIILLVLGFTGALALSAPDVFAVDATGAAECHTSSDCLDGQRCERGKCVSTAHKPRPPQRKQAPRGASNGQEDTTGLALWWAPPPLRRDQFENIWSLY